MAVEWRVRPVIDSDYEQWRELYHGYREFYKQERSDDVVNTVWSWIRDPKHATEALVAVASSDDTGGNKKLILGGLAHHRRWPNPLKGKTCLYLDDLFTLPELRGKGIATLLIQALSAMAKQEGLGVLRWTTDKDNTTARRLYDSLATATSKVTYDMVPGSSSSSTKQVQETGE